MQHQGLVGYSSVVEGEGDASGDCGLCWVKDHGQTPVGDVWVDMKDTVIICVIIYKTYKRN